MDNMKFGAFVAALRAEQGLTQSELAEKLHVTNKAVSKWETGKGFPDIQLLEPLAETLGVTVMELMQGERLPGPLDEQETDSAVVKAMEGEQRRTSSRIFRTLKWCSLAAAVLSVAAVLPDILLSLLLSFSMLEAASIGIIGGADGPTSILIAASPTDFWRILGWVLPVVLIGLFILFAVLEKRKK